MTPDKKYHVVAIAAICVDLQIFAGDDLLENHGLQKGESLRVTPDFLSRLVAGGGTQTKTAGSPGANVAAGIALRGGASALVGKIANDAHGQFLAARVAGHGVDYTPVVSAGDTSCVVVVTTPDKERSFAFAGNAAYDLAPDDIDAGLVARSSITYLDSFLWHSESGKAAAQHAAVTAKQSGSLVAVSLNSAELVGANREEFLALVTRADIVMGDRKEFMTLLGTKDFDETVEALHRLGVTASITAGAQGAHVVAGGAVAHIPCKKVENLVDTCGAGDQFAAGFLYGLAQGLTPVDSAHIGAQWAADIIQHAGAEPRVGRNAVPPPGKGPGLK